MRQALATGCYLHHMCPTFEARGGRRYVAASEEGVVLSMSPAEVLRRAKRRLDSLSIERLRVADDFLAYLEDRESTEATAELLELPGFRESLRAAEAEISDGELTSIEQLRRKP